MISSASITFGRYSKENIANYTEQMFQAIVAMSLELEFISSNVGALLSILHVLVLSRKSMRTSSTNTIWLGIAICDLVCMLVVARNGYIILYMMGSCTPPRTMFSMRLDSLVTSLHNALRRSSAWLGTLMAVVRYLAVSDMANQTNRYTPPKVGLKVVSGAFTVSFLFTLTFNLHLDFERVGEWYPGTKCAMENVSYPIFVQRVNQYTETGNDVLARGGLIVEGLFSKIVPSLVLPVLTVLLLREIRKSLKVVPENSIQIVRISRTNRTTILTILIASLFFVSEFPVGVVDIYKAAGGSVYKDLGRNVIFLCDAIFSINTSVHCLLIFFMSSQYRATAWTLFNCKTNAPK